MLNTILVILKNIFFIICLLFFIICLLYNLLYRLPHNIKTKNLYKREKNNNDKKYLAQRYSEDGDKGHRDYIYLVKKDDKKYQRVVDLYTLGQLGYPRPSRDDDKCFKISDGYSIGDEIKIYNIISDIKDILKLKDKLD